MRRSSLRLRNRLSTSVILALILTTFLSGPPGALVQPGPRNAEAASASGKATSTAGPNLFNPAKVKTSGPQVKSLTAPLSGQAIGPLPTPLLHPVGLPMQPGLLQLDPIRATQFQGSDGRLEIDVPAGAVTATDLATAGGQLSLSVRQIAPASGGTGGGSGRYSFGTYLIQTITGQQLEWMQPLRQPLTFKLHISPEEYAVDVQHAVLVFNGAFPADTNFNPNSSGPMISGPQAHLTPASAVNAALDAKNGLLAATVFMPSDPVAAFNTDSPVATFGKPDVFSADLSAGALSGGYPIDVPAGPAGFKPPLALTYSSAAVNEQHNPQGAAGWVGEGWNLSLGSISWAEHNVAESVGTNWENSWMLNDPFGTSAELIPPNTGVTTFCGIGTNSAPTPPPIVWHTAPENHAKVIEIAGSTSLTCGGGLQTLPCFRAFLPNGVMEEFGCTA